MSRIRKFWKGRTYHRRLRNPAPKCSDITPIFLYSEKSANVFQKFAYTAPMPKYFTNLLSQFHVFLNSVKILMQYFVKSTA